MPHAYDFSLIARRDLPAESMSIYANNEVHPFMDVFEKVSWRDDIEVYFATWDRRRYEIRLHSNDNPSRPAYFDWRTSLELDLQRQFPVEVIRDAFDIGICHQIAFSHLARALGQGTLQDRIRAITDHWAADADRLPDISEPYWAHLSPDTVYFHSAFDAWVTLLDCFFLKRWAPLDVKNVVIHPAMTEPEDQALDILPAIVSICRSRSIRPFLATMEPWLYRATAGLSTVELCENDMHRLRPLGGADPDIGLFMAWDPRWFPSDKGLDTIIEAMDRGRVAEPLYVKIPDGYPDNSAQSAAFYDMVSRCPRTVDIRLLPIPGGRDGLLEFVRKRVDIFVHAGHSDIGPRAVLEAAGMNKRIMMNAVNDCALLRRQMFRDIPGFAVFNVDDFGQQICGLRRMEPYTARFFDTHNWQRTRDQLRAATGDATIAGFWLDPHLVLDPSR